jgi:hypothetical protein
LTAALLAFAYYAKPRQKEVDLDARRIYYRSGSGLRRDAGTCRAPASTIATGLLLGDIDKAKTGPVLIPDGNSADLGRGVAGCDEEW